MEKKLLGLFLLSIASFNYTAQVAHIHVPAVNQAPSYVPAPGPLQLTDSVAMQGAITQALSNPALQAQRAVVTRFAQTVPNTTTYQDIVFAIKNNIGQPLAVDALQAFEQVIMHMYNHEAYMISLPYSSSRSLFFNGIRYNWANPLAWLNIKNWTSDNNKKLDQLIGEFSQLSDIAMQHNLKLGTRMKVTIQSYKNWRNSIALIIAAYLIADTIKRSDSTSLVNTAYDNVAQDCSQVLNATQNFASNTTNNAIDFFTTQVAKSA